MLVLIYLQLASARIGKTAIYDGVTYNCNTYINFTGDTGLRITDTGYGLSSYTMSIWIKMDENPWDISKDL